MTTCWVADHDYLTHWGGGRTTVEAEPPMPYSGVERRLLQRRQIAERRGEVCRGRRYKLVDRRKGR